MNTISLDGSDVAGIDQHSLLEIKKPSTRIPATRIPATFAPGPRSPSAVEIESPLVLRTPRILLRPLRASDRAEFLRVIAFTRNDLTGSSRLHGPLETDDQLFDRQVTMCRLGDDRGTSWRRAVFLHDGTLVGAVNLSSISRGLTFEAHANWWMSTTHTGRGLASEAVGSMLDYALADAPQGLGLHQVHAAVCPENIASARVAAKGGMRKAESGVNIEVNGTWIRHDLWRRTVLDEAVVTRAR